MFVRFNKKDSNLHYAHPSFFEKGVCQHATHNVKTSLTPHPNKPIWNLLPRELTWTLYILNIFLDIVNQILNILTLQCHVLQVWFHVGIRKHIKYNPEEIVQASKYEFETWWGLVWVVFIRHRGPYIEPLILLSGKPNLEYRMIRRHFNDLDS